jgi:hypothetical protein
MFIRAATISQFKKDSVRRIHLALDVFTNFENNSSSWYGVVDQSTGDKAENQVFSCLAISLAMRGQPGREAALARDVTWLTFGELWIRTNDTIQQL